MNPVSFRFILITCLIYVHPIHKTRAKPTTITRSVVLGILAIKKSSVVEQQLINRSHVN